MSEAPRTAAVALAARGPSAHRRPDAEDHVDALVVDRDAPSVSTIPLLELEPELAGRLNEEQRELAAEFRLPVVTVDKHEAVEDVIESSSAFGVVVLDGMLVQTVDLGAHVTLKVVGPGAPVPVSRDPYAVPIANSTVLVVTRSRLVLLDDEFLSAARRWPWLMAKLHTRTLEELERVTAQLAISQLPRVEDRLMSLMWLLAEMWGRVTLAGIRIDLCLSHESLGGLVGARRPTVSLALKQLRESGALVRDDGGWLLNPRSGGSTDSSTQTSPAEPHRRAASHSSAAPPAHEKQPIHLTAINGR